MRRFRAITAVAAALVLAAGAVAPSAADGPGGVGLPYAELAALAGLVAPPRVAVQEATAVRLRPGHDWPVAARLGAGEVVLVSAITHEYPPRRLPPWDDASWLRDHHLWLQIAMPGGASGWIPAARTSFSDALWRRVDVRPAAPVTVRWLGAGVPLDERIGLRARPAGPLLEWQDEVSEEPHGVFGRSVDGNWVALDIRRLDAPVAWASIEEVGLEAADLTVADLPFFVGSEIAVLPLGEADGRRSRSIEAAEEWRWAAGNRIVGVGSETFWSYDAETGSQHSVPRPAGRAELSPDGRQIAVELRRAREGDQAVFNDLALVSLDDGSTVVFTAVHGVYSLDFGPYLGAWSPDSRAFLSPRWSGIMEFSVVTLDGERHELPDIGAGRWNPWRWRSSDRLVHEGWETIAAVNSDGTELDIAEHLVRRAETSIPHWPALQEVCELPDGDYEYQAGPRGASVWVSVPIDGAEGDRIRACLSNLSNEVWRLDGGRTLISDGQSGALWLFDAASGWLREIIAARPPERRLDLRVVVSVAPGAERLVVHRYGGPWPPDAHLVELFPPYRTTDLAVASGQTCGQHWNWSPDGEQFAALADAGSVGETLVGPDGLTAGRIIRRIRDRVSQIRFIDRTGELLRTVRTLSRPTNGRLMEARWSPDGRWLAIGGYFAGECIALGH